MSNSLKYQAVQGVIWSAIERFSVQGIQFILGIIIARLITPSEYGLIAMLGIFLAVAQTFIDSGFSNALIQKKDRTDIDFSTVFFFNLVIAIIAYCVLFFLSPLIAIFYKEPQLETIARWVGLILVISGFSVVQRAKLTIKLDFKTQAKASFIAIILSGTIGVILAYKGFGVWVLVVQALCNNLIEVLLLWIYTKWIPSFVFSWKSFDSLFSFGSKLLVSGLLNTIYVNLYTLVIGRRYSAADVGYYNRASSLSQFPSINIVTIITRAIYPVQCMIQDNEEVLSSSFIKYLRISCYVIFPLMIGFSMSAKPLVLILLTEKWLPMAELFSILCIAYMWYPIMVINNQILNVKGRTDYFLKAEIIKKALAIGILLITMPLGVKILCWGILLYNLIDVVVIVHFAKKVIQTGYWEQLKLVTPSLLLSIGMGSCIYFSMHLFTNLWLQLLTCLIIGLTSYFMLSYFFCVKEFNFLISIIQRK